MRKLLFIAFILPALSLFGQDHFLGIKTSLNFVAVNSDDLSSQYKKSRATFSGDVLYEYLFHEKYSIISGISYVQQGYKSKIRYITVEGDLIKEGFSRHHFHYIGIPVKFSYKGTGELYGFMNLGLRPAFLVSAQIKLPSVFGDKTDTEDLTNKVTNFDIFGLIDLGLGYNINPKTVLFSTFSYTRGFMSITNSEYLEQLTITNSSYVISVGIKINFNRIF